LRRYAHRETKRQSLWVDEYVGGVARAPVTELTYRGHRDAEVHQVVYHAQYRVWLFITLSFGWIALDLAERFEQLDLRAKVAIGVGLA